MMGTVSYNENGELSNAFADVQKIFDSIGEMQRRKRMGLICNPLDKEQVSVAKNITILTDPLIPRGEAWLMDMNTFAELSVEEVEE